MEQIRNFDQLLQAALAHGRKGIAVAAPYDKNTLLAVKDALASGLAAPQLFGDVERMLPLLEQVQLDAGAVKLTDVRDTAQAIDAAIESIRSGENQILMKGTVSTGTLLKHALDRTRGLNIGRLASHLIVLQIPGLDRLLISTDGGQVENPHWELAMEEYMQYLVDHGIPEEHVYHMTRTIPSRLLGLED